MEVHLIGYFKMSGDATGAQKDLESFFEDDASDLLGKGAPTGCGAKLLSWSIDFDRLNLDILSDRYVRSHDAMLRLRKH